MAVQICGIPKGWILYSRFFLLPLLNFLAKSELTVAYGGFIVNLAFKTAHLLLSCTTKIDSFI